MFNFSEHPKIICIVSMPSRSSFKFLQSGHIHDPISLACFSSEYEVSFASMQVSWKLNMGHLRFSVHLITVSPSLLEEVFGRTGIRQKHIICQLSLFGISQLCRFFCIWALFSTVGNPAAVKAPASKDSQRYCLIACVIKKY